MNKILIACLLSSTLTFGQSFEQKDSLINEVCKTLNSNKKYSDKIRLSLIEDKHIRPFLLRYPESQRQIIDLSIFYRMQLNCVEYLTILERDTAYVNKRESQVLKTKPKTKLDKIECNKFRDLKWYKWMLTNGDTVNLQIENGLWIDHFKDGSYSKLSVNWISDCEFDIKFVESDNDIMKNISRPGDTYRYRIIDKKDKYYYMIVQILRTKRIETFKLFY